VYSEIYEPLLSGENAPKVVFGYTIVNRTSNEKVVSTGGLPPTISFTKAVPSSLWR
jgi:hypothetical protein